MNNLTNDQLLEQLRFYVYRLGRQSCDRDCPIDPKVAWEVSKLFDLLDFNLTRRGGPLPEAWREGEDYFGRWLDSNFVGGISDV